MRLSYWLRKLAFPASYFAALLLLALVPLAFGAATLVLSGAMFARIEYERNLFDHAFCRKDGAVPRPGPILAYTTVEVAGKSVLLGLLGCLLFLGTDSGRLTYVAAIFVATVWIGVLAYGWLDRKTGLHLERWGYTRLSLATGVVFSLLLSLAGGMSAWAMAGDILLRSDLSLAESAELVNGLLGYVDRLVADVLTKLLGSLLGGILSLVLSTDVMYGFLIVLYVFAYRRLRCLYDARFVP